MPDQNIPVSIIIPTLNEEHYLPLLLESLTKIKSTLDVIVVDGHSEDKTIQVASAFISRFQNGSSLRIVSVPRGTSRQRNSGGRSAQHDVVLFLDADTIVPSNETFQELIQLFVQSRATVGAPYYVTIERNALARLFCFVANSVIQGLFLFGQPYFAGICIITTKATFTAVEGFNESIVLAEDVDYAKRAAKRGAAVLLPVEILISARRLEKYGYLKYTLIYMRMMIQHTLTGQLDHEKIFYPFGEYRSEHKNVGIEIMPPVN